VVSGDAVWARVGTEVRAFDGPGLLRKPRVGETLVSRTSGERMDVIRFDSLNASIVHVKYESGRDGSFIWQFSDCLNRLIKHGVSDDQ
jgi:hypothetical protein